MVNTLLDPILHQPLRTQIAAYLAGRGKASFSELKKVLDVTDGNLDAHLKKMIDCDYVQGSKDGTPGSRQTIYVLSAKGMDALVDYLKQLEKIVGPARSVAGADQKNARHPASRMKPV